MSDIIVLGAARSGTKFIRDTLAMGESIHRVPFDVNFIWRSGNEGWPDDALPLEACTDRIADRIRSGLRQAADQAPGSRLIEKTVSNTVRLPFVARVFPDAYYIHLVRDGREVVASSLREWLRPTDWRYLFRKARTFPLANYRYALWYLANRLKGGRRSRPVWGVRYPGIEADLTTRSLAEVCALQWLHSVSAVRRDAALIPGLRIIEVRYEELVGNPDTLPGLVAWLDIADRERVLTGYRKSLQPSQWRPWDNGISERDREAVLEIIGPMQRQLGYS